MNRLPVLLACFAITVAGCGPKRGGDVMSQKTDGAIARVTQCTVPNSDGVQCDRKTCRKDEISDCAIFRDRCKESGHDYEGNNDSGTCIRKEPVG